jgi:hypothetical protein
MTTYCSFTDGEWMGDLLDNKESRGGNGKAPASTGWLDFADRTSPSLCRRAAQTRQEVRYAIQGRTNIMDLISPECQRVWYCGSTGLQRWHDLTLVILG